MYEIYTTLNIYHYTNYRKCFKIHVHWCILKYTASYKNSMCIFEVSHNKTNTSTNVNIIFILVANTVPCWLLKHTLDIPLILTTIKIYKSTASASYGPVLHCYKKILWNLDEFYVHISMYLIINLFLYRLYWCSADPWRWSR